MFGENWTFCDESEESIWLGGGCNFDFELDWDFATRWRDWLLRPRNVCFIYRWFVVCVIVWPLFYLYIIQPTSAFQLWHLQFGTLFSKFRLSHLFEGQFTWSNRAPDRDFVGNPFSKFVVTVYRIDRKTRGSLFRKESNDSEMENIKRGSHTHTHTSSSPLISLLYISLYHKINSKRR